MFRYESIELPKCIIGDLNVLGWSNFGSATGKNKHKESADEF